MLQIKNLRLDRGGRTLFEQVELSLQKGQRVGIIGRNGVGKSSLFRLIKGEMEPDEGSCQLTNQWVASDLPQHLPRGEGRSVREFLLAAIEKSNNPQIGEHQMEEMCSRLSLPIESAVAELSGGVQRRVLLARALLLDPDLLLLDEPTNHLDIEQINFLERYLKTRFFGALLLITHDRVFLENNADIIWHIHRQTIDDFSGSYYQFLKHLKLREAEEERAKDKLNIRIKQEERYLARGVTARRKRNQLRVGRLQQLREQREGITKERSLELKSMTSGASGEQVVVCEDLGYQVGGQYLFNHLDLRIHRGEKIGLVGPNGCGKSTLINLLLKRITPTDGGVTHGSRLQVAYFEQGRESLDENKTLLENMSSMIENVETGESQDVRGYLKAFLFQPNQYDTLAGSLSGGEQARLMLAKKLSLPCNVLILDEPTNDLDLETLEILEDFLAEFDGTVILVSHDRAFLDNLVGRLLVFDEPGKVVDIQGNYTDYQRYQSVKNKAQKDMSKRVAKAESPDDSTTKDSLPDRQLPKKLSYKETQALEQLPLEIDKLEKQMATIQTTLSQPNFYQEEPALSVSLQKELKVASDRLEQCFEEWEVLEEKQKRYQDNKKGS